MSTILEQLDTLEHEALNALLQADTSEKSEAWYGEFLGRKGRLTAILRGMGQLSAEERPAVGKQANLTKVKMEEALQQHQEAIARSEMESALSAEGIDVTLPGRPQPLGKLHPTTQAMRDILDIFGNMGFQIYDAPEVETDDNNFTLLNFPPGHPAREMQDTFFTKDEGVILRTHTSPGQIRAMREFAPEPIRVMLPGKCYRNEDVTTRSEMMFYQVEGLVVGRKVTMSDLKGVLLNYANKMYGEGRKSVSAKPIFPLLSLALKWT